MCLMYGERDKEAVDHAMHIQGAVARPLLRIVHRLYRDRGGVRWGWQMVLTESTPSQEFGMRQRRLLIRTEHGGYTCEV